MSADTEDDAPGPDEPALPAGVDLSKLQALMQEQMRWTHLHVSMQEISEENPSLVADLGRFDRSSAIPLLAGLLLAPGLQSNCIRLEILLALAVVHCAGSKRAGMRDLQRWFRLIRSSLCVAGEDPAEDVFVTRVTDGTRDYRVLEGVWESAGFYTQRVMEVALSMPDEGAFIQVKRSIRALLLLSDAMCERAGLQRYDLGSPVRNQALDLRQLPKREDLASLVRFEFSLLDDLGITPDDLAPFLFDTNHVDNLLPQQVASSDLDRCPLVILDADSLVVTVPSAISVALREFVLRFVADNDLEAAFDGQMAARTALALKRTPLLGALSQIPVGWRMVGDHRIATVTDEVDSGHFLTFQFVLPSVRVHQPGGFKGVFVEEDELARAIRGVVEDGVRHFSQQPGFKRGLVVRVSCGWGKGYLSELDLDPPDGWEFEDMSVADLIRVSALEDMKPLYFWRIQDALAAAERAGLYIENINGVLNAIAWVRSNNGHVVPHEQLPATRISPDRPFRLMPPLNLLREVRAASDRDHDTHLATDLAGTVHRLQRVQPHSLFARESIRKIYGSLTAAGQGVLTSVYKGRHTLWASVIGEALPTSAVSQLWEMTNEWLHRVGRVLDALLPESHDVRHVHFEFLDEDQELTQVDSPADLPPLHQLWRMESNDQGPGQRVVFDRGFLHYAREPENVAERQFVTAMLHAYLFDHQDREYLVPQVLTQVVENTQARHFHLMHAQGFADYVRESLPRQLVSPDALDDAGARFGLGWRVLPADHDGVIEGKEACKKYLFDVVDLLSKDLLEHLGPFQRQAMLVCLIGNHEKASNKERHWVRSSAAMLALHGTEALDAVTDMMSEFAGASVASRVLAEMALCACPLQGETKVPELELRSLMGRALLLIHLGGVADAIHFNALKPSLRVSALGNILFEDDFGQFVVAPTLRQMSRERYVAAAPHQHKNYRPPELSGPARGRLDPVFLQAWQTETGMALDQVRDVLEVLDNKGIRERQAILLLRRSEFVALLREAGLPDGIAERFLAQFALVTRELWDTPPTGFAKKDLFPWRFGRRLSFVSRPVLVLDESADPNLLVAPASLRRGIAHIVGAAHDGRLEQRFFRSPQMRNEWMGQASKGHEFNAEVSDALKAAGWKVRPNIGLPEILGRKLERDYGDVDVLAWWPGSDDVLAIECKDLSPARNYSEMAALLSAYQGIERDGEPDKLKRHLDRLALLAAEPAALTRLTGIASPRVVGWLACSGAVPMQFAKSVGLSEVRVGGIADLLEYRA
jgi:hypothetical protein